MREKVLYNMFSIVCMVVIGIKPPEGPSVCTSSQKYSSERQKISLQDTKDKSLQSNGVQTFFLNYFNAYIQLNFLKKDFIIIVKNVLPRIC